MRLELRITVWLTVLLGAAAALTLLGMTKVEQQNLNDASRATATLLAQTTENSLEVSMLNNAADDIRRTIHDVEEGAQIDAVAVYRRNGTVWVSSAGQQTLDEGRRAALLTSMNNERTVTSEAAGRLSVFVPVRMQAECVGCHADGQAVLGAVEVRTDQRPFQQRFAQGARLSLVLAAIPLVLGIGFSIIALRRSLLGPLAQVAEASEAVGSGDLSARLPEFRGAELGLLSSTFNDMVERVETQSEDLHEAVERLRNDLEGMEEIESLLISGAGLREVLLHAAENIGHTLDATGVGIWLAGADVAAAEWGQTLPSHDEIVLGSNGGPPASSAGPLPGVPQDAEISWAVSPARRDDKTLAVVGVVWDPPRQLDAPRRDLLASLSGLVAIAVENTELLDRLQQKEQSLQGLLRNTINAQEEERRRISRELHDETSQVLSALMMNIDLLETQLETQGPGLDGSRARVEAVKNLAEEAARNLDKMMLDLRPALLDELGLVAALRWYVSQVSELWGLDVTFEAGRMGRLPDHVEVAAFRIVQEAVSNCVRHAEASRASVRVEAWDQALHLEIVDDGVGFDVASVAERARTGEAVGLMGMRERAELAGGTFHVESSPGSGTRVSAELPLTDGEKAEWP
ncbi:MAG: HAMP domain-containing sensor histidine kinase [Actinomycetota bacterium]